MKAVIMPFIEQAVVNGLVSKTPPLARKNKFGLSLMVLSGLFLFSACVFLMIAGYGWLMTLYSPYIAALLVAFCIFAFALIASAASYAVLRHKPKQVAANAQADQIMEIASLAGEVLEGELADVIRENPKTIMLLASVAGFVAADRLH